MSGELWAAASRSRRRSRFGSSAPANGKCCWGEGGLRVHPRSVQPAKGAETAGCCAWGRGARGGPRVLRGLARGPPGRRPGRRCDRRGDPGPDILILGRTSHSTRRAGVSNAARQSSRRARVSARDPGAQARDRRFHRKFSGYTRARERERRSDLPPRQSLASPDPKPYARSGGRSSGRHPH